MIGRTPIVRKAVAPALAVSCPKTEGDALKLNALRAAATMCAMTLTPPAIAASLSVQTIEFYQPSVALTVFAREIIAREQAKIEAIIAEGTFTEEELAFFEEAYQRIPDQVNDALRNQFAGASMLENQFTRVKVPLDSEIPGSREAAQAAAEALGASTGAPSPVGALGQGQVSLEELGQGFQYDFGDGLGLVPVPGDATTYFASTVLLDPDARTPGTEAFLTFTNFAPTDITFHITPYLTLSDVDPIAPFLRSFDPFVVRADAVQQTLAPSGTLVFDIGAALDDLLAFEADARLSPSDGSLLAGFRVECLGCTGFNLFGPMFEERALLPGEDPTAYNRVSRFLTDDTLAALEFARENPQPVPLPAMGAPFALVLLGGLGAAAWRQRRGG